MPLVALSQHIARVRACTNLIIVKYYLSKFLYRKWLRDVSFSCSSKNSKSLVLTRFNLGRMGIWKTNPTISIFIQFAHWVSIDFDTYLRSTTTSSTDSSYWGLQETQKNNSSIHRVEIEQSYNDDDCAPAILYFEILIVYLIWAFFSVRLLVRQSDLLLFDAFLLMPPFASARSWIKISRRSTLSCWE